METITSRHNPLVAHLRRLASSGSYRRERGEFLCDSPKLLHEALLHGAELLTVAATRGMALPDGIHAGVRLVEVPEDVMQLISPAKTPQGVVFTCRLPRTECPQTLTGARYLALDGVQDPGNVGTIIRTADAAGLDGVLLSNQCADVFSPKVLRATMGSVFRMNLRTTDDLPGELTKLREKGYSILSSQLDGTPFYERQGVAEQFALVIGNEGNGVSEQVQQTATHRVRLPMRGGAESLNAAIAAAIMMYELMR